MDVIEAPAVYFTAPHGMLSDSNGTYGNVLSEPDVAPPHAQIRVTPTRRSPALDLAPQREQAGPDIENLNCGILKCGG